MRTTSLGLLFWLSSFVCLSGESPAEPPRVPGYLMLHGNNDVPPSIAETFIKVSGSAGKPKMIVVVLDDTDSAKAADALKKGGGDAIVVLKANDRVSANGDSVATQFKDATGAWLLAGPSAKADDLLAGTALEKELRALLQRGGVIAGAASSVGHFLPGSIVEPQGPGGEGHRRLLERVTKQPTMAGFGIDANATLFAHERQLFVAGGDVSVCLAASGTRPLRDETLEPGSHADLVALTRAATARTLPAFPPATCGPCQVEGGTLVIDGGGIPKDVMPRFIQAAGGPDALILVIPTAMGDDIPAFPGEARMLKAAGAKNLKIFHLIHYADAFDPAQIKIIDEAKGIWFCGGRQWRYVDAYLDTPAEQRMHALLKRGGAIGGSSAGATIQGDYLVRGNPLGNVQMMSEGYERGLAFLKGVAIDQHFVKRNRFADMSALKKAFPQLLGLGIDEGAAVVVLGHILEVIGVGPVCIYDKKEPATEGQTDYVSLKPGEKYDLKKHAKIDGEKK